MLALTRAPVAAVPAQHVSGGCKLRPGHAYGSRRALPPLAGMRAVDASCVPAAARACYAAPGASLAPRLLHRVAKVAAFPQHAVPPHTHASPTTPCATPSEAAPLAGHCLPGAPAARAPRPPRARARQQACRVTQQPGVGRGGAVWGSLSAQGASQRCAGGVWQQRAGGATAKWGGH